MGKSSQRRIDFVLKRKRDDTDEVEENRLAPVADPLPFIDWNKINRDMKEDSQMNLLLFGVSSSYSETLDCALKFGNIHRSKGIPLGEHICH